MEIKTQAPVKVMYKSLKTTLSNLKQDVGQVPEDLYAEAAKLGLQPSGPQHWVYFDASDDPNKEFTLQMCLPVQGVASSDKYEFQELPEFKHTSTLHNGSWDNFHNTYDQFFKDIFGKGLKPTNQVREVYLTVDMEKPENNVTEIQAGIES